MRRVSGRVRRWREPGHEFALRSRVSRGMHVSFLFPSSISFLDNPDPCTNANPLSPSPVHPGSQPAAAPVPSAKATSSARSPATIPALRLLLLPLLLLFLHKHLFLLPSNTTTIPSSKKRAKCRSRALRAGLLTLLLLRRNNRSVARTRIWRILSAGVGGDCAL